MCIVLVKCGHRRHYFIECNLFSSWYTKCRWKNCSFGVKQQSLIQRSLLWLQSYGSLSHVYQSVCQYSCELYSHPSYILYTTLCNKLWKERLNSDGQQFNKYQLSQQTPLTLIHWTKKKTMADDVGNTSPSLGQVQKCGRVKPGIKFVNDQQ